MKYAVSEEGVSALRGTASNLVSSAENILEQAQKMTSIADGQSQTLGPHYAELIDAIEEIQASEKEASDAVEQVSAALNQTAEKYEDIIGEDPFAVAGDSESAKQSLLGAAVAVAAVAGIGAVGGAVAGRVAKMGQGGEDESPESAELRRMGVNRVNLAECSDNNRAAVLSAVKTMFQSHPELCGQVSEIACIPMKNGTYASYGPSDCGTNFGGVLHVNSQYFSNPKMAEDLREKARLGWFTPNASPESVVIHELGHGLHLELCELDCGVKNGSVPDPATYNRVVRQYMDNVHAEEIVEGACADLGIDYDSWAFSDALSRYGGSDEGEAIAEAVAEAKGSPNPRPMARAIYQRLVEYQNKLKRRDL